MGGCACAAVGTVRVATFTARSRFAEAAAGVDTVMTRRVVVARERGRRRRRRLRDRTATRIAALGR